MKRARRRDEERADRVVYVPRAAWGEAEALVTGAEHHHLSRVLRCETGDHVAIVDGDGGRGGFRIVEVGKRATRCVLVEESARDAAPRVAIELAPCVTRAQRMDWLIEKATELGVAAISPVLAERSIVKARAADGQGQTERWERVAIAAMKQSRRASKPAIGGPRPLAQFLAARAPGRRLIAAWERAPVEPLAARFRSRPICDGETVSVLIGPEGGLSDLEAESIEAGGGELVGLGASILRAETAAVAMLVILLYEGGAL